MPGPAATTACGRECVSVFSLEPAPPALYMPSSFLWFSSVTHQVRQDLCFPQAACLQLQLAQNKLGSSDWCNALNSTRCSRRQYCEEPQCDVVGPGLSQGRPSPCTVAVLSHFPGGCAQTSSWPHTASEAPLPSRGGVHLLTAVPSTGRLWAQSPQTHPPRPKGGKPPMSGEVRPRALHTRNSALGGGSAGPRSST